MMQGNMMQGTALSGLIINGHESPSVGDSQSGERLVYTIINNTPDVKHWINCPLISHTLKVLPDYISLMWVI